MVQNLEAIRKSVLRQNGSNPQLVIAGTAIKANENELLVYENDKFIPVEQASETLQKFIVKHYTIPAKRTYNKNAWHVYRNTHSYKNSPLDTYNQALRYLKNDNEFVIAPKSSAHSYIHNGNIGRVIVHRIEYQDTPDRKGTYSIAVSDLELIDEFCFIDYNGGNYMGFFIVPTECIKTYIKDNNLRQKGNKDSRYYVISSACIDMYSKEGFTKI